MPTALDMDILKMVQQLIWIYFVASRLWPFQTIIIIIRRRRRRIWRFLGI